MYFSRVRVRPEIFRKTQLARVMSDNIYNPHRLLWDLFPGEKKRCFLFREEIAREQFGVRPGVRGEPVFYLVSSCRPVNGSGSPIFKVDTKEYHPKLRSGDRLYFELRANPVVTRGGKKHDVVMDAQRSFLKRLCAECDLLSQLPDVPEKKDYKNVLLTGGGRRFDERITSVLANDLRYAERLRHSLNQRVKLEWALKVVVQQALDSWLERQGRAHGFSICIDDEGQPKLQSSAYRWHGLLSKAAKGKKPGFSSVDFTGELQVVDVERFTRALFEGIGRSKSYGCGLMMVKRV